MKRIACEEYQFKRLQEKGYLPSKALKKIEADRKAGKPCKMPKRKTKTKTDWPLITIVAATVYVIYQNRNVY